MTTASSDEIKTRNAEDNDLDRFHERILQIFLDAFTTDGFVFNAQRATPERAINYLRSILDDHGVAFLAFDSGRVAYPYYPIGFLFGGPLSLDRLLSQTSIPDKVDTDRCGYLAELAVDRGHRGRGVGHRLVDAYLAYCREQMCAQILVRTNDADSHLHAFYCSAGFAKLDITARQYISEREGDFVTKRYFGLSLSGETFG